MQERKIPTIVGLLLVGFAVMLFRFAFERVSPLLSKASGSNAPKHVTITNVTDTSFTVSWITSEPTSGSIRLDGTNETYSDEKIRTATTHSVTIRSLQPETNYSFRIMGQPYETRTAPSIIGVGSAIEPAYGQVTTLSGAPLEGALVYVTLDGGQTLSTMTKSSGTWVIPLNLARTQDLSSYIEAKPRIDESILIRTGDGESTAITDTLNDNPVPVMTIGKTYDFRKIQAAAPKPPSVLGTSTRAVTITQPLPGSAIPSNLPLFQGTGIPGNQVLIVIGMDQPISDTVIVEHDGIFRYTPPKPLQPGKQSVTITTRDAQGKTVAITHTFEILKSGTQVLGDATPSATLTPEPTATLAGEPVPETGFPLPLFVLISLGMMLFTAGAFVVVK